MTREEALKGIQRRQNLRLYRIKVLCNKNGRKYMFRDSSWFIETNGEWVFTKYPPESGRTTIWKTGETGCTVEWEEFLAFEGVTKDYFNTWLNG